MPEGAKFCSNCGKATENTGAYTPPNRQNYYQAPPYQYSPYMPMKNIVQQLSEKVKIEAVIWLVIACIQYIFGLITIASNAYMYYPEQGFGLFMGVLLVIVASCNLIFVVRDFKYSTDVLQNPVGIIGRYAPMGGLVATLVYNLFLGGVIGIAGSIYGFVIRNFVMTNQMQFAQIEQQFAAQMQQNQNGGE